MKPDPRLIIALGLFSLAGTAGPTPLNYQLRLEPVYARIADRLGEMGSIESVEFSPDGSRFVSGSKFDFSVIVWRTSDGRELWRGYAGQEIERVGWSADASMVATASEDFKVTIFDAEDGEVLRVLDHGSGIDGLTWSHQGALLATGTETKSDADSASGYVRVFDMAADGEEIARMDFGNTVNELFFTKDDAYLLAVGHGAVRIYRTEDWSLAQTLERDSHVIFTSGAFSPDGEKVVAVGREHRVWGQVYIWEWREGKVLRVFNHTGKKIESITWHPNGEYLVHAGHDPYIYVYRLEDVLRYGNDYIPVAHQVWASDNSEYLDFNADGSFLASAHQNGLVKLWVWMGEDPAINRKRHEWISKQQENAGK